MLGSDETLQSVLSQVFFEFMDGDFEVIRNMISKWTIALLTIWAIAVSLSSTVENTADFALKFYVQIAIDTMNNTAGGVRLGDDVIGVIEEMFLRLRFVLHGKTHMHQHNPPRICKWA